MYIMSGASDRVWDRKQRGSMYRLLQR